MYSCKKESASVSEVKSTNEFNVSVTDGRLVFKTIDDYRKVCDQPSTDLLKRFYAVVNSLNYTSFGESLKTASNLKGIEKDDFFQTIVNPDKVVQIGEYFVKVNALKAKVFVLPVANVAEYHDLLSENIANNNIRKFSVDDEVIDILDEKSNSSKTMICKETGVGGRYNESLINDMNTKLSVEYLTGGIVKSLVATIDPVGSWPSSFSFDFTGGTGDMGYIHYHQRCGSTSDYETVSNGEWRLSTQIFKSYQGSTKLNEFYFGCRVLKDNQPFSQYVTIRVNY